MRQLRILLVEDDESLRRIIAAVLRESTSADVVPTSSVLEAATAAGPWDLIVLDRRLPDGDGMTVAHSWPGVPSVTISAYGGSELQKPFSMSTLRRIARERLGMPPEPTQQEAEP